MPAPPRILHVDSTSGAGGSTRSLRRLMAWGAAEGWWTPVLLGAPASDTGMPDGRGIERWSDPLPDPPRWDEGVPPGLRRMSRRLALAWFSWTHRERIAAWAAALVRAKIDLVHLNTHPLRDLGLRLAAARAGLPVVCHLRAVPPGRGAWPGLGRPPFHAIAVSRFVAGRWIAAGVPEDRIRVVPNGFPASPPDTARPRNRHVVAVGRLVGWKNHHHLLEAWTRLSGSVGDAGLDIVGDGPELPGLRAAVDRLGLAGRVVFHGHCPDGRERVAAAAALVHPALDEPLGGVLIEAMRAGTPVVALRSGGNAEILDDGACGWLVPPDDPAALAAAIREVLAGGPEVEGRVRAARLRAETVFDYAARSADQWEVFRRVLEESGRRTGAPSRP